MEQLDSHWTDFHEIQYLSIFQKQFDEIQVTLKSDKNGGYFVWRFIYIYYNILFRSSENEKNFWQNLYGNSKHDFMFNNFFPKIDPFVGCVKNMV